MKKTDFFRRYAVMSALEDHIFKKWANWWTDNNKGPMPECGNWDYHRRGNNIIVTHPNGEDIIPISEFYGEDDQPELIMLWYHSFFDGPMNGVASMDGEMVWFEVYEDEFDNIYGVRTFGIYSLTEEEKQHLTYWHDLFCQYVSITCDYRKKLPEHITGLSENYFFSVLSPRMSKKNFNDKDKLLGVYDQCQFSYGTKEEES